MGRRDLLWCACAGVASLITGAVITLDAKAAVLAGALTVVVVLAVLTRAAVRQVPAVAPSATVWALVALPSVYALHVFPYQLAVLALLSAVVAAAAAQRQTDSRRIPGFGIGIMTMTLAGILLRPSSPQLLMLTVLAIAALVLSATRHPPKAVVNSLLDGVALYLILNVIAYTVGIRSPAAGMRIGGLESSDGGERVLFPLTGSLNLPPAMAAVFLASSLLFYEPKHRMFRLAGAGAAVLVLLGSDARAAMATAALLALGSLTRPNLVRRLAVPVGVISVLFAFAFPFIASQVVAPTIRGVSAVVPGIDREGESTTTSLNGRQFIWQRAVSHWNDDVPPGRGVVGYGAEGQIVSGASAEYASLLSGGLANPLTASTHDSGLQQLYDGGYVGLAGLLLMVTACLRTWARREGLAASYATAACMAIAMSGITEVVLSPGYAQEPFFVFLGLFLAGVSRPAPSERAHVGSIVRSSTAPAPR